MNSDIKPDFEKLAEQYVRQPKYDDKGHKGSYMAGCEKIWTDHFEPTVKRLQEEKKELVATLKLSQLFLKDVSSMKEVNGVVYDVNSARTKISNVLNKEQLES